MKLIAKINIITILSACLLIFSNCNNDPQLKSGAISIPIEKQGSTFVALQRLINEDISQENFGDSLAFLILPIDVSCASCRKKTIDSIMRHINNLPGSNYIIISARSGRKMINSYFLEQDWQMPKETKRFYLDTINLAFKEDLYYDKPTFYYTVGQKAITKIEAIPATIKQNLRDFFNR